MNISGSTQIVEDVVKSRVSSSSGTIFKKLHVDRFQGPHWQANEVGKRDSRKHVDRMEIKEEIGVSGAPSETGNWSTTYVQETEDLDAKVHSPSAERHSSKPDDLIAINQFLRDENKYV